MWVITLCPSFLRPLRDLLLHRDSRCCQVGIMFLFLHSVKYGVGVCLWLEHVFPYGCHWANQNSSDFMICVHVVCMFCKSG